MSQNVTLLAYVSPVQSLAVEALAGGSSVTAAAKVAGVARETVSRWVHHDPVFIAELQNIRAELALQTRCALEALGMRSIAALREALQNQFMLPSRLRAACAVLKLLGADRAETLAPTTPLEVRLRLGEHEQELQERQARLEASEANAQDTVAVAPESEPTGTEAAATEPEARLSEGSEPASEAVDEPRAAPDSAGSSGPDEPAVQDPANQGLDSAAVQALQQPSAEQPVANHPAADSGRMSPAPAQDAPVPFEDDELSRKMAWDGAGANTTPGNDWGNLHNAERPGEPAW